MTRFCTLAALIAAIPFLAGCLGGNDSDKAGGEAEPDAVVLTLANPGAEADVDEFVSAVESQSNGSLRIEVENAWRAGASDSEQGTIEDVRKGEVDLGSVGARAFDVVGVDTLQPLVAPFAVDSYALEREVLDSPLAEQMLDGVKQLDLVGITILPGELRKPLGVSRALMEASDYRGATIGLRPSELSARAFRALGATTEGYPVGGDISSFDGIEVGIAGIEGDRYDGPGRTLAANVSLWPRAVAVVINQDVYEALSDDQREVLSAAGRAALDPAIEAVQQREEEALEILCNRDEVVVRSASRAQLAALREATAPVARAIDRDPTTREAAREIAAMRAHAEAEPTPACAGDATEQASGGATPVDGLWLMETTEEELAEISPPGDIVPENWGRQTFALWGGRFAFTEENDKACIWGYGTYAVKDEIVELTFKDGGGQAPNDAANRPGEVFQFGWSRYRDQLTLTAVKGEISPASFRVKPWRRLEGEPSVDALSGECPPPADALQP
jgi:TRAP-type C4-dicarboxylate transport system substrate-binding protein